MDIMPPPDISLHLVQSYGAGRFVVQGAEIAQSILIWPSGIKALAGSIAEPLDIPAIITPLPELLIVGTGLELRPISPELTGHLKDHNIKLELMDTGAACRTYNVLAAEDRRVAALLEVI